MRKCWPMSRTRRGPFLAVLTTLANRDDAQRLARALIERKLVACAQISEVESFYRWQGTLHNEPEFRLLCKTTQALYERLEQAILELHPYELPAIHALAIDRISDAYAGWIEGALADHGSE